MASSKRNPKPSKPTKAQKARPEPPRAVEVSVPNHFRCPISLDLMTDPVTVSTGITYDRASIETWLEAGRRTCPVTQQDMEPDEDPIPNHSLRRMIQDWCVANRSLGVDRIPTPKIPLTSARASEILSELADAELRNCVRCRELAGRVRSLAKESDKNRRCFVQAGAGRVLAALFEEYSASRNVSDVVLLDEILSALTLMLPLDKEACRHIASSFGSVVSIMRYSEDLASRLNSVLVLTDVLSRGGRESVVRASRAEGLAEALVEIVRRPISPRAAKTAMSAVFCLVSSDEGAAMRLLELGIVPLVLETLVESERPMCEKALAVLDAVCGTERGREEACGHALTVPVLVKKMFRVSDAATEFVVSALWKLCRNCEGEGEGEGERRGVLVEATQVGAFQKVLLLLQVGCSAATKEKATQLLKMMNGHRGHLDCIDTMDLRGLRKSF